MLTNRWTHHERGYYSIDHFVILTRCILTSHEENLSQLCKKTLENMVRIDLLKFSSTKKFYRCNGCKFVTNCMLVGALGQLCYECFTLMKRILTGKIICDDLPVGPVYRFSKGVIIVLDNKHAHPKIKLYFLQQLVPCLYCAWVSAKKFVNYHTGELLVNNNLDYTENVICDICGRYNRLEISLLCLDQTLIYHCLQCHHKLDYCLDNLRKKYILLREFVGINDIASYVIIMILKFISCPYFGCD